MKANYVLSTLILTTLVAAHSALAETSRQTAPPLRGAKRVASRRPGSVNSSQTRAYGAAPREPKAWELRIGLVGGYSQLNSADGKEQATRSDSNYNRNFFGGVQAQVTVWKYLGADLEGFFGTGPARSVTTIDRVLGTTNTTERKLQQYGGMGAVEGRYPFWIGKVKLSPKAGVGYGILRLDSEAAGSGTSAEDGTRSKLTGAYATVGFDAWILPELLISADYSRSFTTSASTDST